MQIKELHIETNNLSTTCLFYQDRLGLPVVFRSKEQLGFNIGSSLLYFHLNENSHAQYHIAFNIPCNLIKEAYKWLSGKAEPIVLDNGSAIVDFRNWNAESVYFLDNNGNILECIARKDLENGRDKQFDHTDLLAISEVGVVTENVKATCDSLISKFGMTYFDKQPPLKSFSALGDDEGLLIISSSGRNWYPTEIPSKAFPVKICIDIHHKLYMLSSNDL
jgi:catechol-2,3-dioxygenase